MIERWRSFLVVALIGGLAGVCFASDMVKESTVVFESGKDGYNTFRIPAMVVTKKGTVLAFCEGRAVRGDSGAINIVLRRSEDDGKTWKPMQVVWADGENTCGNPCAVVDEVTGVVWLVLTHNLGTDREGQIINGTSKGTRTVWVTKSADDGVSWAKPVEITKTTKLPNWTWYATGPGAGIQLTKGEHKGRLVIPCDHIEAGTKKYYSHVIYSDDHGKTWELGGSTPTDKVNECEVVELSDGRLMLNMRNYDRNKKNRAVSLSDDGGASWSELKHDTALIEPICQASIRRYDGEGKRILFSNPASTNSRVKMTVRLSDDDGKTWIASKLLHEGPSAYSCLAILKDGTAACFYEKGQKHPYETITFERFSLGWLTKRALLVDELAEMYPDRVLADGVKSYQCATARGVLAGVNVLVGGLAADSEVEVKLSLDGKTVEDSGLYRFIDVPVGENTGIASRTEKFDGKENPYVICDAPFRVYEALEPAKQKLQCDAKGLCP